MRICIPAADDRGLESTAFGHFGSAPYFVVVDTDTDRTEVVLNENAHHAHGGCQPLAAFGEKPLDAVLVGGIGRRAIIRLQEVGTSVYRAVEGSVADNLRRLQAGDLEELTPSSGCAGHR